MRAYGDNLSTNVKEGAVPHTVDIPFSKATGNFGTSTRTTYNKNGTAQVVYSGSVSDYWSGLGDVVTVAGDRVGFTTYPLAWSKDGLLRVVPIGRVCVYETDYDIEYDESVTYKWVVEDGVTAGCYSTAGWYVAHPPAALISGGADVVLREITATVIGRGINETISFYTLMANAPEAPGEPEVYNFAAASSSVSAFFGWVYEAVGSFITSSPTHVGDGYADGERTLPLVTPAILVYDRVDGAWYQVNLSDAPIASLGQHACLPRRGFNFHKADLVGIEETRTVPRFISGQPSHTSHSRFMGHVTHVSGGTFIFPYYKTRQTYLQAKAAWVGSVKTAVPGSDPTEYYDQQKAVLYTPSGFTNACVMFNIELGYTTDNFVSVHSFQPDTTYNDIQFETSKTSSKKYFHAGSVRYNSELFTDGVLPECKLFNPVEPVVAALTADGKEFLMVSTACDRIEHEADEPRYVHAVYGVNLAAHTAVELHTFRFEKPVIIHALIRAKNICVLQVSYVNTSTMTADGMSFFISVDDGVSWVESAVSQFQPKHCGSMSLDVVGSAATLMMPVFEDGVQRVYRKDVGPELDPSTGWVAAQTIRVDVSDPDDLFNTAAIQVTQVSSNGDTGFKQRDWYNAVVFSDTI